ncbi:hypothetical protein KL86DPRO_70094 [uncultured delta proteobacterium]|uniref:Radical SAM core domain-containing protein n=1 Tax=uncultured delta proteobacterium TaxID=34034 RepID=A0A212KH03_9DELT|nr:hypothetical protein KL86DPRO_70094 [uncultured delta proteobacterium]
MFIQKIKRRLKHAYYGLMGKYNSLDSLQDRIESLRDHISLTPRSVEYVMISPSYMCTYECFFCSTHSYLLKPGEYADAINANYLPEFVKDKNNFLLPLDTYERLIRDLKLLRVRHIDFSGIGEPLLHPDIVQMVALASKNGIGTSITSNGSILTPEKFDALASAGLGTLVLSVNSLVPERYEQIHGKAGREGYKRLFGLFEHIAARKQERLAMPVYASFAITPGNMDEIEAIEAFKRTYLLDKVNYTPVNAHECSMQYALSEDHVNSVAAAITRLTDQKGEEFKHLWESTAKRNEMDLPCYTGTKFVWINSNGDVICCCFGYYVLGNIKKQSFQSIWTSDKYILFRKKALSMHLTKKPPEIANCTQCPMPCAYHEELGDDAAGLHEALRILYGGLS